MKKGRLHLNRGAAEMKSVLPNNGPPVSLGSRESGPGTREGTHIALSGAWARTLAVSGKACRMPLATAHPPW